MVTTVDPKHDPVLIERGGYSVEDVPRAYLSIGNTAMGESSDPEDLLAKMDTIEANRREGL